MHMKRNGFFMVFASLAFAFAAAADRDVPGGPEARPRYGDQVRERGLATRRAGEGACERAQREFRESQECFARFRVVGGGVKAEAFEHCKEIMQPQCRVEEGGEAPR